MRLLVALVLATVPFAAEAKDFTFKDHGKVVATLSLEAILKKVPSQTVPIFEPHEGKEKKYTGVDFRAVLQAVYGDRWQKAEELLFTCLDGYQPSIPAAKFLEHKSILAYRIEGQEFIVNNKLQNEQKIDLNPFYLVWDNVGEPALKDEGATDWPYQVNTVDLIQFQDHFAQIAPPTNSHAQVIRGFLTFRKKCMTCHTINGDGGSKALELNYPVSAVEYFKPEMLEKWLLNPSSIRYNTTMPGLEATDKSPKTTVKDVLAYLQAMAKQKRAPKAAN